MDAGLIYIGDAAILEALGANEENWQNKAYVNTIKDVEPGKYYCKYTLPDTWNGVIDGDGIITITSGVLVISDPCYAFSNKTNNWHKALDKTMFFESVPGAIVCNDMGGDGDYKMTLELTKING